MGHLLPQWIILVLSFCFPTSAAHADRVPEETALHDDADGPTPPPPPPAGPKPPKPPPRIPEQVETTWSDLKARQGKGPQP